MLWRVCCMLRCVMSGVGCDEYVTVMSMVVAVKLSDVC